MKKLTWKQLFDFCNNQNVTVYREGHLLTIVEVFWLPFKRQYSLTALTDDSYSINTL